MSKGIIVIDIPETCDKCKMGFDNECSGMFECFLSPTRELDNSEKQKPDWCPIQSVPDKLSGDSEPYDEYDTGYCTGWDSCLEKILGEEADER